MTNDRLQREAQFFNHVFAANTRARGASKFYTVARAARRHFRALIDENCKGQRVLEYGCGKGKHAFILASRGADVVGIDISVEGIRQATAQARTEGLEDKLTFEVMNAEALEFPDDHFDIVCGDSILHHLNLDSACHELVRVLKPEGRAVFREPLGHNLLINLYRKLTPRMRTEDEHPLLARDIETLAGYFQEAHIHYYALCTLMAVPFRALPGFKMLLAVLEWLDGILLRLPFVKRQAWQVVVQLDRPLIYRAASTSS